VAVDAGLHPGLKQLAYLGTPELAVTPLRALHEAGHDIAVVVTQPDRRRGRGGAVSPSPVKQAARELGLAVSDRVDDVIDAGAELGVVVAFGRLIRPHVLAAVPMVNMHFSLLPRWRGAAPVERAILAGDTMTGVCIMDVAAELDAGDVYAVAEVPIGDTTTADQLRTRLVDVGTRLLLDVLAEDLPKPAPQSGDVSYAEKLRPDEWRLDWSQPAVMLSRWVRAGQAWTTFRGKRLRVFDARLRQPDESPSAIGLTHTVGELVDADHGLVFTGADLLQLSLVQPEGRSRMLWADFAHGAHPRVGERFE
jgi:methionyl-tRNA formyltransferase